MFLRKVLDPVIGVNLKLSGRAAFSWLNRVKGLSFTVPVL